ncbi:MAG: GTPase HflX [Alphaproteobacteria bacterium]|nr:GTPase HflX [Alphaproteobacteria bacterium]
MTEQRRKEPVAPRRAIVLHVGFKGRSAGDSPWRDAQARLDEAVGLTAAIGLVVVAAQIISIARPVPATLIGSGKFNELAELIRRLEPEVVVVNAQLSPVQQRNLERAWQTKVLDRTALILEIFGERAKTREGRLQVELAHLTYQRSRLVRSWTHLERQRGGFGFLGGPGETQIETDRRLIGERLAKIRRELESVKRTRGLHRQARRRVPYPIVALVGYTNAGKSTLFNTLTKAQVMAENLLFATLDPTMRAIRLPDRRQVILSDTVGFISDLPTELVAAFRATLEEVLEADLIVHVRDASHQESEAQKGDVLKVLSDLGIDAGGERPLIEALNKIDLLEPETRNGLLTQNRMASNGPIAISAITGVGLDTLLERMATVLGKERVLLRLELDASDGEGLAWTYAHSHVLSRNDREDGLQLEIAVDPLELERFSLRFRERLKPLSEKS